MAWRGVDARCEPWTKIVNAAMAATARPRKTSRCAPRGACACLPGAAAGLGRQVLTDWLPIDSVLPVRMERLPWILCSSWSKVRRRRSSRGAAISSGGAGHWAEMPAGGRSGHRAGCPRGHRIDDTTVQSLCRGASVGASVCVRTRDHVLSHRFKSSQSPCRRRFWRPYE